MTVGQLKQNNFRKKRQIRFDKWNDHKNKSLEEKGLTKHKDWAKGAGGTETSERPTETSK